MKLDHLTRDITRLEQANQTMRLANLALQKGDLRSLKKLGFDDDYISELQRKGGFRSSQIQTNVETISFMKKLANGRLEPAKRQTTTSLTAKIDR